MSTSATNPVSRGKKSTGDKIGARVSSGALLTTIEDSAKAITRRTHELEPWLRCVEWSIGIARSNPMSQSLRAIRQRAVLSSRGLTTPEVDTVPAHRHTE